VGEVAMMITIVPVDDTMVAIIDVSEAPSKPVVLYDDNHFYVRAGANNRQLPPNQWKAAIRGAS
jgi:predicted HTH transcriptional regulator